MNQNYWMFSGVLVLLGAILLYVWLTRKRIDDLEITVDYLRYSYNKLFESQKDMEKEILEFRKSIEENQGSMQVCSSTLSGAISKFEKRLDILEKASIDDENDEKAEPEEDECDEPPASEIEYWAGMEKLADIVDPANLEKPKPDTSFKWSHEGEIIGYRWVFPTKEKCTPIVGQDYMVVGLLHGYETMEDGSPFISTEHAEWDGFKFICRKTGNRFSKVYAYIRMPNSSDIMKSILEITLHDRDKEG